MKDIILYHGSRGGIVGPIQPESRSVCDFGSGFYLGTNPLQAKGLIVGDASPILYTIKLNLSEIPEDRILTLSGEDWVYAVLANRRRVPRFNQSELAKAWLEVMTQYDVIIGPIADDRMNDAMKRFSEFGLTDKGLEACLASIDYGTQYVLKTEFACSKTEVLVEQELYGKEADDIRKYTQNMRNKSLHIVEEMAEKYAGNGRYLSTMLKEAEQELRAQSQERGTDYERE